MKVFLLYMAGVFLCIHNFVPHSHAEISISKSTHEHHGDDHHEHEGDTGSPESSPLELPAHQESLAKYIVKHNSEPSDLSPELLYDTILAYSPATLDPIILSYVFPPGNFRLKWDYLSISSSYLRGPPSLIIS